MVDRRACLQWLTSAALAPSVWAQNIAAQTRSNAWPRQPVQMIVPYPVGGTSAILAKHLSKAFERNTRQSMRLNYQSGTGGLMAAAMVAKAAIDGQTLLMGGSHLAAARALMPEEEFDFMEALRPLALVAKIPQVLLVNPARMRSRTIMEWMLELARKPVRYRMATAGMGSSSHIYSELLKRREQLEFEFVHFRGSGPALQDLLTGAADMMVDGLISCLPHVRSGRLKALLVSGHERSEVLPDVPCAQEIGLEVLDSVTWYGIFAPQALPDRTASAVIEVCQRMGQDEVLQASFQNLGIRWGDMYGHDFSDMVRQETLHWAQALKDVGLSNLMFKPVGEV